MIWLDEHEEVAVEQYLLMRSMKMSIADMYQALGEEMPADRTGGDNVIELLAEIHASLPTAGSRTCD